MEKNIFHDFEQNKEYTIELLDGISFGVCLFMVSDEIKFLHFNLAADELFGYEKGGLLSLTDQDSLSIFHPDYVDRLYKEIISTMRDGRFFNYDCRILCKDGSYRWTNLSAELVQQKEGGRLYFHCVLSPIAAPRDSLLKGCHFLIAAGDQSDRHMLTDLIEGMGGTCETTGNGMDALDLVSLSEADSYKAVFIGSRLAGVNGFELAKEIRHCGHPDSSTLPLILLISTDDEETVQISSDIRIAAFLKKPLKEEDATSLLMLFAAKFDSGL